MSKYVINDTTLTAIGDAVREKGGTTELIPVNGLANAIINLPSGGGEVEPIELSGDLTYGCAGTLAGNYIDKYGNTITTKDITNAYGMFYNSSIENIPFIINMKESLKNGTTYSTGVSCASMFQQCRKLKELPQILNVAITNANYMFQYAESIREIPENYFSTWTFPGRLGTGAYSGCNLGTMFNYCYSLKRIKDWTPFKTENINPELNTSYTFYNYAFTGCYVLEEIYFPVYYKANWTSNVFGSTFTNCHRLSKLVFEKQADGSPYVCTGWKNQTIDLSQNIGYFSNYIWESRMVDYNSGITKEKRVSDAASYEALKNDPDWYCYCVEDFCRYNYLSAIETINSLPDVSAGSGNTIKFRGNCGALTDGGAINNLTEEEIAIAAAKGWTVTLV